MSFYCKRYDIQSDGVEMFHSVNSEFTDFEASYRATDKGWVLRLKISRGGYEVWTKRGQLRVFTRLDAVARFVKRIGEERFSVKLDSVLQDDVITMDSLFGV
jgi:hypothetical protein